MSESSKKSLLNGITLLSISGIICKFIGVIYRIPMAWLIHEEGLGLYQLVFPTYSMLLTISTTGLPVAISRSVSYSLSRNDTRNAKKLFKTAFCILAILGFIFMIVMMLARDSLALSVGNIQTNYGFVAIAPSLFIVCMLSAFRGYIQGMSDMKPTAISQLIEQVGKVIISLPLAYVGMKKNLAYAAAGALWGVSFAEFIAVIYMYINYKKFTTNIRYIVQDETIEEKSYSDILKYLAKVAIPMTIGGMAVPFAVFIDSTMIVNRLKDIGFTVNHACSLYGIYTGLVITLINVPTALAIAISISIVPAIASAVSKNNIFKIKSNSIMGLRFAFIIGIPCSIGMSIMAEPLLRFFYSSLGENTIKIAASLLSVSSFTVILFTLVQATSGILQGLEKPRIPMYTLLCGVLVKIILNYTFVGNPNVHIHGAPFASIACYLISTVPNIYYVNKYCDIKFYFSDYIFKPLFSSVCMGFVLYGLNRLLPYSKLNTIIILLAGSFVFFAVALFTGTIKKSDINIIRGKRG